MKKSDLDKKLIELKSVYDELKKNYTTIGSDGEAALYDKVVAMDDVYTDDELKVSRELNIYPSVVRDYIKDDMLTMLLGANYCLETSEQNKPINTRPGSSGYFYMPTSIENADFFDTTFKKSDGSVVICKKYKLNSSRHFIGFSNQKDNNNYVKIYFNMDENNILPLLDESLKLLNEEGGFMVKTRFVNANDMVTFRVFDVDVMDKVLSIVNKYKIDYKNSPFLPIDKDTGLGITYDDNGSFNDDVSKLLWSYFNNRENISSESFADYFYANSDKFSEKFKYNIDSIIDDKQDVLTGAIDKVREKPLQKKIKINSSLYNSVGKNK